jgi:hypothetical protein
MDETFLCPNCEKDYPRKEGLAGRRVRCSGCGHVFRVPAAGYLPPPVETALPPRSVAAAPPAPDPVVDDAARLPRRAPSGLGRPRAARRSRRSGGSDGGAGARDSAWLWTAGCIIAYGLLVLILPHFGLQFRKAARLGENAWIGGVGLIALGVIMGGFVLFRRELGVALRFAIRVALVLLGLAVGVLVLGAFLVRFGILGTRRHLPAAMPYAAAKGFVRQGPAGGPQPGGPWGPARGPLGPRVPPSADDPAKPGYIDRWRAGFGAVQSARVRIIGTAGIADPEALVRRLGSLRDPTPDQAMSTSISRDRVDVLLMPVRDLDRLAARIDFGTVTGIDQQQRLITVTVDPAASPKR